MPASRTPARRAARPVQPPAERPLALTAAWAGLASALVGCVVAIAVVAVVWLPASGTSGSAGSAIRAGILTFLAAVHGGVTVDGLATAFVPLGLTLLVAVLIWRAATAVAAAAADLDEDRPALLLRAVGAQAAVFAATCGVLAAASPLGTSSAPVLGGVLAGFVLTAVVAAAAMLRHSPLGDDLPALLPDWLTAGFRCAGVALAVHVAAGALLVGAALVVHHDRVTSLSQQVGGGWSGLPVLLLGVLAAPNAAVAGAGYLSGAGFAVGSGTTVGLTSTTTGLVPAFPVLGALPAGDGASLPAWLLAVLTPLLAGGCVAVLAGRAPGWAARWHGVGAGVALTALLGALLAWQGGGGIGSGKLHAVGVSPWQFGLLLALWTGLSAASLLGLRMGVAALRTREQPDRPSLRETIAALTSVEDYGDTEDEDEDDDDLEDDGEDDAGHDRPAAGGRGTRAG